jgi:hypothetical protein
MPQSNDVVDLSVFVDEWSRCVSSRYQRDSLYRFGRFDSCTPQWSDLKLAFKAKTLSNPDEAQKIVATTHYQKNLGSDPAASPTAGVIWELKSPPGWD